MGLIVITRSWCRVGVIDLIYHPFISAQILFLHLWHQMASYAAAFFAVRPPTRQPSARPQLLPQLLIPSICGLGTMKSSCISIPINLIRQIQRAPFSTMSWAHSTKELRIRKGKTLHTTLEELLTPSLLRNPSRSGSAANPSPSPPLCVGRVAISGSMGSRRCKTTLEGKEGNHALHNLIPLASHVQLLP